MVVCFGYQKVRCESVVRGTGLHFSLVKLLELSKSDLVIRLLKKLG